jgi:putative queuosine salvage protein
VTVAIPAAGSIGDPAPLPMALLDDIRSACEFVANRAQHVTIDRDAIDSYARALDRAQATPGPDPAIFPLDAEREARAAFTLALDAVNFGSGWFPTLRKRAGRSGYTTIALALRDLFDAEGGRFSPQRLAEIDPAGLARALGQDRDHELIALYATHLRELGERVVADHGGSFAALADAAHGSAQALAELLAGWPGFADTSRYDGRRIPFFKRAQIAAADLASAGVLLADDLERLTMFADNLVAHVLRIDGVLRYEPELLARIDRGELLEHDSPEEVEIRACALHSVELLVAALAAELSAAQIDGLLWRRGAQPRYKAQRRHRARCTAY